MKKVVKLDIEYPKRITHVEGQKPVAPEQISFNIILHAMNSTYGGQQKQMSIKQLRMWAKIQDRISDDDGNPATGGAELSDEQFTFLFDTLNEASYPPGFAAVVALFMDHIEAVKLAKEETKEAVEVEGG